MLDRIDMGKLGATATCKRCVVAEAAAAPSPVPPPRQQLSQGVTGTTEAEHERETGTVQDA
jgi:hypothetical protein